MPSPPIVDIDSLLTPIPGENPSGVDVRYTRYDEIKEARREEEDLPQGDWKPKGNPKVADWGKVIEVSSTVLSKESKDLQVAVWLIEALVKQHGFAGLRDGLKLFRELHNQYWETLYPEIEDDDLETRAAPAEWLNENQKTPFFPFTIKSIPLMLGNDGSRYSYFHWEQSREVENLGRQDPKKMAEAIAEGKITKKKFDEAEIATPLTHCLALLEDVQQCCQEIEGLEQVIKEKYGESHPDRPSLSHINEIIGNCRQFLEDTVQKKGGAGMNSAGNNPPPEGTPQAVIETTGASSPAPVIGGGIDPSDRLDALRRLAAVAEYFRKTEPHSPVAYLVQRATRWGEMPLEDWLNDVIKSKEVLGSVRETLGLKEDKPKQ